MQEKYKKRRTSFVWKSSSEEFKLIVEQAECMKDILAHYSLKNRGNNYKTVKKRMEEDGLLHYSERFKKGGFRK